MQQTHRMVQKLRYIHNVHQYQAMRHFENRSLFLIEFLIEKAFLCEMQFLITNAGRTKPIA